MNKKPKITMPQLIGTLTGLQRQIDRHDGELNDLITKARHEVKHAASVLRSLDG